ncbi:piggyBac transposable element-derived protein 4-like [Mycetomoellerius zeteki]|uniref:piggyBac transposable element-derived protein 4-like n=1 Tax=Mycetomoellerius zeteki TaxID=64791 RepID=UPI00084E92C7|nr:PREDICTED: piggyBac transposable element-derived protein 4-like [Trachymyrmex zeteki]
MCAEYNKHMGYVDYSDRLLSSYNIDRRARKWWLRIFWYFVDLTIINSFIIYKSKAFQPTTLKQFRLRLVQQLVEHKLPTIKGRKRAIENIISKKSQVSLEKRLSQSAHMPMYITNKRRCANCSNKKKMQISLDLPDM